MLDRPCVAAVGAAPRMKPHAALTSTRPARVWLVAALLLLAAPLAVAVWGLGGYSADRERSNADTRLAGRLNTAGDRYRNLVADAGSIAARRASEPRVQRAFLRGRVRVLAWRMSPN